MTMRDLQTGLPTDSAGVIPDPTAVNSTAQESDREPDELDELATWVLNRLQQWRNHRRTNYELLWDEYERLWRAIWMPIDVTRKSEKSTLITPALSEAVENIVAEVEEALWGRGDSFDMKAPFQAQEDAKKIVDDNKAKLKEDLGRAEFNANVGEALINAAVYGSGIGEIQLETFKKREISASVAAMMPGVAPQAQVIESEVTYATLVSVNPRNCLIEPTARSIDKSLGVAIEEYVGAHVINSGIRDGKYRDVDVGTSAGDQQLGADRQLENEYVFDKVHVIRYFGLVPKSLLFPPDETVDLFAEEPENQGEELGLALRKAEDAAEQAEEAKEPREVLVDLNEETKDDKDSVEPIDSEMVEAVIVIANQKTCLKAVENPYLMQDRPVVAFPWDVVPGRFWGRGVCEKGLVPQRVMDAELRARIDALAFISAPMMAMDASRLPRGFQLTVRPGKSILTNGDPNTVLRPMHFGQLEQSTFTHSQQLDQMIQRATGSLDVIALAQRTGGDSRPGAVSMMLSGIVKRHKRTLMNFVDRFYVPALRKILWRNMQYYPERYTPRNWDFVASSTMGILQREYETQNLTALLQTMDPTSPEYKMILMGVVSNTGLTHRQDIINMLRQSIQTSQMTQQAAAQQAADPQAQQLQSQVSQVGMQLQIAEGNARIRELNSRAGLQEAKTQVETMRPQMMALETATKGIYNVAADQQQKAFDTRLAMSDRFLKAREIQSRERIVGQQTTAALATERLRAAAQVAAAHHAAKGRVIGDIAKAHAQVKAAAATNAMTPFDKTRQSVLDRAQARAIPPAPQLLTGSQGVVIS